MLRGRRCFQVWRRGSSGSEFLSFPNQSYWGFNSSSLRSRTIRNPDSARISIPSYLKPLPSSDGQTTKYEWVTDLTYTSPYWNDWFGGMSRKFLEARGGKFLLLAGTDRLDKELMIGQMQGKYQLQVLPEAGHFIQEDVPEKTARLLIEFWKRNDGSLLVLPPKVGSAGK